MVIICSRLDLPGGIEKASVALANLLAAQGHIVTLLVAEKSGSSFYHIDEAVKLEELPITMGIGTGKNSFINKIHYIRDVYKLKKKLNSLNPSLIISTEYPYAVASVMTGLSKKVKLVSWEHHHFHGLSKSKFWEMMIKTTYPKLYKVVCPNPDETAMYAEISAAAVTIPHFITKPTVHSSIERRKEILTIGWLSYLKGTDMLMTVAKQVLEQNPGWNWRVIGKGDMLPVLSSFITEHKLEERLILTPPQNNDLSQYYQTASLLVHTSRMESFGLTIAEAMSYGLPAAAFDCPTGPRHIIQDGENGLLAAPENTDQLTEAITRLINDDTLRTRMGEDALLSGERFSPDAIYPLWEALL